MKARFYSILVECDGTILGDVLSEESALTEVRIR